MIRHIYLLLITFISSFPFAIYGDTPSDSKSEKVRQTMNAYVEAFNRHDPKAMSEFWAEDAVYTNPVTGATVEGREAIAEEIKKWFEDRKADKLEVKLVDVKFPEQGKAEEKGVFRLTFQNEKAPLENGFRADLSEKDGKWFFDEVYQVQFDQAPTQYDHLKPLEWLIGDWIDTDENLTIETKSDWDKYKNFITQRFNLKMFDQQLLEGRQIIGWDPVTEKIRSWVFDSDGGFGEGKWTQKGNKWYVNTAYTRPDGRKASAIHIYTKIDDNTYTWASEGRDVDGEMLPNLAPVKVVRVSGKEAQ